MESWDLTAPHPRLPVSLLTGFLGSGKTTVLNHLVRHPALKRTLVIINEFGAIGLDHDLLTHSEQDVVVEMSSGCLCCTIRGDLVRTLRDAIEGFARDGKPGFDRAMIETTGLADPAPVLHTLMTDPVIARQYRLDCVMTTVDAATGMTTLDRQIESVKQAAVADRLLLTKTDLVEPDAVATLIQRLTALNPGAPIIHTINGAADPEKPLDSGLYNPNTKSLDVRRWLNAEAFNDAERHEAHDARDHAHDAALHGADHHGHHHDVNRHDDHIRAVCLTLDDPIPGNAFDRWLERTNGSVQILAADGRSWTSAAAPVLATGFAGSTQLISDWFDWTESGRPILTEQDESTRLPGLFLVGREVQHRQHIFCFIYKFRQRFAVVARAIAGRLGMETDALEAYRANRMYLDDLSCCDAANCFC